MKTLHNITVSILGSRKFFYVVVGLLVLQAGWIALSTHYPMPFDENYHLEITQLYASRATPVFTTNPTNNLMLGAVARDPSFLYHYLMSFPYRLITLITTNFTIQVIFLRFINIGLFATGLFVYRRLLKRTGLSEAASNTTLLFLILIPFVPFLAAQFNYDTLFFLMTGAAVLLTMEFAARLKQGKFDSRRLGWLGVVCAYASLVKYAFLPILLVLAVYTIGQLRAYRRASAVSLRQEFSRSFTRLKLGTKISLIILFALGAFMCLERYGLNLARYKTPVPECNQVLSIQQCQSYGPWNRNYNLAHTKAGKTLLSPLAYSVKWVNQNAYEMVFVLDQDYNAQPPLPIIKTGAYLAAIVSGLWVVYSWERIRRQPFLTLFAAIIAVYCMALWAQNYLDYRTTADPVSIHGRYLVSILPLWFAIISFSLKDISGRRRYVQSLAVIAALMLYLQGGGFITYILRSNPSWYWQNQSVLRMNSAAKRVLAPIVKENP